jgi:glucose-6-phosphate isomerase
MIQRSQYLQQIQQEKQLVLQYIKNNRIIFSEIEDVIPEKTKNIFLQWISQANMNSQKKGRTEYGQEFSLVRKKGTCVLHCTDGNLTMPAYVMEFKE